MLFQLSKQRADAKALLKKISTLQNLTETSLGHAEYKTEYGKCSGDCLLYIDEIGIQRATMEPGTALLSHQHVDEEETLILYSGDITVLMETACSGTKQVTLERSGTVVIPANTSHVVTSENGCKIIGITVPAATGYPTT